jgi:hypothetical protein
MLSSNSSSSTSFLSNNNVRKSISKKRRIFQKYQTSHSSSSKSSSSSSSLKNAPRYIATKKLNHEIASNLLKELNDVIRNGSPQSFISSDLAQISRGVFNGESFDTDSLLLPSATPMALHESAAVSSVSGSSASASAGSASLETKRDGSSSSALPSSLQIASLLRSNSLTHHQLSRLLRLFTALISSLSSNTKQQLISTYVNKLSLLEGLRKHKQKRLHLNNNQGFGSISHPSVNGSYDTVLFTPPLQLSKALSIGVSSLYEMNQLTYPFHIAFTKGLDATDSKLKPLIQTKNGTSSSEIIGNQLIPHRLDISLVQSIDHYSYSTSNNTSALIFTSFPLQVRMLIVWDFFPGGKLPKVQDVLYDTVIVNHNNVAQVAPSFTTLSSLNPNYSRRFQILYDTIFSLPPNAWSSSLDNSDPQNPSFEFNVASSNSLFAANFSIDLDQISSMNEKEKVYESLITTFNVNSSDTTVLAYDSIVKGNCYAIFMPIYPFQPQKDNQGNVKPLILPNELAVPGLRVNTHLYYTNPQA